MEQSSFGICLPVRSLSGSAPNGLQERSLKALGMISHWRLLTVIQVVDVEILRVKDRVAARRAKSTPK